MFKKLRNSMLRFNMITLTSVILIAFTAVFLISYLNMERDNQKKLQSISSLGRTANHPFWEGRKEMFLIPDRFAAEQADTFFLFVRNGKIEYVDSYLDFNDSVYREAWGKVGNSSSGKISLEGQQWVFTVKPLSATSQRDPLTTNGQFTTSGQYIHVTFLDVTSSSELLRVLFFSLLIIGLIVSMFFFLISYKFAARAVQPIEEGYEKQKQFVADASHELRTPLAIISANVDAIEASGEESVDSQKQWFAYIHNGIERSEKLVDTLLYLARAEDPLPENNLPMNLSHISETVSASMEAVLYDSKISFRATIDENIHISGDEEKIKQVLYILLDNAKKYTPAGGQIELSVRREHDMAVVRATNTGSEIDADELPRIFDRFYRPDGSRSQDTGGLGLGLSIAKTIVENSGGEISAESAVGQTTFTLKFKLL
ncbi:MAG TPA: GHKL domain-containing protein [Clostridiaceae bacterium]|nr:GHKL domain-containing protein [Clostridiaceae bacterium]